MAAARDHAARIVRTGPESANDDAVLEAADQLRAQVAEEPRPEGADVGELTRVASEHLEGLHDELQFSGRCRGTGQVRMVRSEEGPVSTRYFPLGGRTRHVQGRVVIREIAEHGIAPLLVSTGFSLSTGFTGSATPGTMRAAEDPERPPA